jgi:hypothetical protein
MSVHVPYPHASPFSLECIAGPGILCICLLTPVHIQLSNGGHVLSPVNPLSFVLHFRAHGMVYGGAPVLVEQLLLPLPRLLLSPPHFVLFLCATQITTPAMRHNSITQAQRKRNDYPVARYIATTGRKCMMAGRQTDLFAASRAPPPVPCAPPPPVPQSHSTSA